MKNRIISIAVAALLTSLAVNAGAQPLDISGSTTVHEKAFKGADAKLKSIAGTDIQFLPVGSGKGLIALTEGKVTVAASSETLPDTIASAGKSAKDMGKSFAAPANLQFHEIGKDEIVVIVHKYNPVQSLTKAQIKDLTTGKTKNWKEVGGADLAVKVIASSPGSGTRSVFQKQVMDGAEYAPETAEMRTTMEEVYEVGKNMGAIGALSSSFVEANKGQTKTLKTPPIGRPIALITIGEPSASVKKLVDYFRSAEGKTAIQ